MNIRGFNGVRAAQALVAGLVVASAGCGADAGMQESEPLLDSLDKAATRYEVSQLAPAATLKGAQLVSSASSENGQKYVDFSGQGSSARWDELHVREKGQYYLTVRYANGSGRDRPLSIDVNNQRVVFGKRDVQLTSPSTGRWSSWKYECVVVTLSEGFNVVSLQASSERGGPNISQIYAGKVAYDAEDNEGTDCSTWD